jgi:hypothetical protein
LHLGVWRKLDEGHKTMTDKPDYTAPRVWHVNVYEDGTSGALHKTRQEAVSMFESRHKGKTIRVVEQPEENT